MVHMNETVKPMYAMTENEILDEISIVKLGIEIKCRELKETGFDMALVNRIISEYETDTPLYSMNRSELVIYLRDKHKVYSRICSYLSSMPDVYDDRDLDSLISFSQEECESSKEIELTVSSNTVKTKDTIHLSDFMSNYRKYRELQAKVCPTQEIKFEGNALDLLRSTVLNKKP